MNTNAFFRARRAESRLTPLLLLFAVWINPLQAQQTLTLVGDPWPPYVNGELGSDADSGIAVDIAAQIFSRFDGVEVRFPLIPWKRALLEVEQGSSDGIGMLLKTPEREAYMAFTVPLITGQNLVWSVADADGNAFEWEQIADLQDRRIGAVKGYSYGDEMDRSFASGTIDPIWAPNVEQLFAMLAAGRVDLAVANDAVGYALARQFPGLAIRPARNPVNSETFYMGFSRKSTAAALVPQINAAIRELHDNGVIDRLVRGEAADPAR